MYAAASLPSIVTCGRVAVVDELVNSPLLIKMGFTALRSIIGPVCRKNLHQFRRFIPDFTEFASTYNGAMVSRCGVLRIDRVVVHKSQRLMHLLSGESVVRSFRVALGRDPVGHKQQEGD